MNIQKIKDFADTIKHCGDYGELWVNEGLKTVYWVGGDADFEEEEGHSSWEYVEEGFAAIDGVDVVEIEAESAPDERGRNGWKCLGTRGIEIYNGEEFPIRHED